MKKNLTSKNERCEENYRITKNELKDFFKKIDMKLAGKKFVVDNTEILIPSDKEIRVKLKYEVDKNQAISIRISWLNNTKKISNAAVEEDEEEI